jgi:uncharacterized protein with HEPN domain
MPLDVQDVALLHDMLLPWRAIMATRNILAHDYDEVNHDIVWRIVQDHLPPLIAQLQAMLAQAPPPPADAS